MSLNANRARLTAITKELVLQWDEARNHWRDARGQEFEKQYVEQLMLLMSKADGACEKLDTILTKARTDCE